MVAKSRDEAWAHACYICMSSMCTVGWATVVVRCIAYVHTCQQQHVYVAFVVCTSVRIIHTPSLHASLAAFHVK